MLRVTVLEIEENRLCEELDRLCDKLVDLRSERQLIVDSLSVGYQGYLQALESLEGMKCAPITSTGKLAGTGIRRGEEGAPPVSWAAGTRIAAR